MTKIYCLKCELYAKDIIMFLAYIMEKEGYQLFLIFTMVKERYLRLNKEQEGRFLFDLIQVS